MAYTYERVLIQESVHITFVDDIRGCKFIVKEFPTDMYGFVMDAAELSNFQHERAQRRLFIEEQHCIRQEQNAEHHAEQDRLRRHRIHAALYEEAAEQQLKKFFELHMGDDAYSNLYVMAGGPSALAEPDSIDSDFLLTWWAS